MRGETVRGKTADLSRFAAHSIKIPEEGKKSLRKAIMRLLGLDIGDRTIGVAVSDVNNIIASGVTTIERIGIRRDTTAVVDLIREYGVTRVVCGLPRRLDGTDSPQTEKVRTFVQKLANKLRSSGAELAAVEIVFEDEALTTVEAADVMIRANVSPKDRKKIIDRQAAIVILQSYIEDHYKELHPETR